LTLLESTESSHLLYENCYVALIDIFLPDGDEIDLVRELRQIKPRLGILVLTGSLEPSLEVLAKEVLYKAAGVVEIAEAIKRVIERRASS
jgi:DNA-binding NarL/FixJ family response regulator